MRAIRATEIFGNDIRAAAALATLSTVPTPDDYVTPNELAAMWMVAPKTVRKMLREGRIEGARTIAGRWVIPRSEADAALERWREDDPLARAEERLLHSYFDPLRPEVCRCCGKWTADPKSVDTWCERCVDERRDRERYKKDRRAAQKLDHWNRNKDRYRPPNESDAA